MSTGNTSRNTQRQKEGNPGCGCLVIILIVIGIASFFAISRNADFPGADTLRTAGNEATELYRRLTGAGEDPGEQEAAQDAPTPTPRPTSMPAPAPTIKYPGGDPLEASDIEHWVLVFTNQEREKAGLQPLVHDPAISEIARAHSENMIRSGFSHILQGKDPTARALDAGYNCRAYSADGRSYTHGLSENIAERPRVQQWRGTTRFGRTSWSPITYDADSQNAGKQIVQQWMDSPGHKANIMVPDAHRIGVGVSVEITHEEGRVNETMYATQNFSSCK